MQVALAIAVTAMVAANGPVTYVVGGLPAVYGIGLLADGVSSVFVVLVAVAAATLYLAVRSEVSGMTDSLWLLLVAGLTGVTVTADVFNLYVFLEISGVAAYALVAGRRGATAAFAALHYLLVGTVGATFYLLGVGYAYVATGTLAMASLRSGLASAGYGSPLVVAAFVLIAIGLSVKIALFPLHTWKPDAYAAAPLDVTALLATLGSTVAGYALVRIVFDVFTVAFLTAAPLARTGLLAVGVVSVLVGGYLTFRQSNVQRLLATSSVLQFGLVTIGIALGTTAAVVGALLLLVGNAVAKGGLFVAAGLFERDLVATTVADYAGLAREAPVLSAAIAVGFASLVGLPPTVGFAGKWYLALAAIETSAWGTTAVVVGSTLLSLVYAGRVVEQLYFAPESSSANRRVTDGGRSTNAANASALSDTRAVVVVIIAAVTTVVLGLGSTELANWFTPVVEGWL
ncbi:proton-conducting transporter transmembrane domain-containing protein [Halococcus hamelinensis]|uniref:Monovalent cation/H+ antiporter subunit D n=1 Tax=Halococcus hamelinensis 100A6 TaxID=1132509 RepID=M0MBP5_9EURY|nr:proton-conducting transporter membrane subunit [Halococcus hamelinensis]EMA42044.1 monovalent cation/H+ antiporter subunit D [Halococcus hamelinensis 100A6]